ncbi:MAG: hypothetical protein M3335_10395, partial [Actinomycetota bacterium]|nr:hypothetical protein [Actinomycetota bacterium]
SSFFASSTGGCGHSIDYPPEALQRPFGLFKFQAPDLVLLFRVSNELAIFCDFPQYLLAVHRHRSLLGVVHRDSYSSPLS